MVHRNATDCRNHHTLRRKKHTTTGIQEDTQTMQPAIPIQTNTQDKRNKNSPTHVYLIHSIECHVVGVSFSPECVLMLVFLFDWQTWDDYMCTHIELYRFGTGGHYEMGTNILTPASGRRAPLVLARLSAFVQRLSVTLKIISITKSNWLLIKYWLF